jgi:hypothetical protein
MLRYAMLCYAMLCYAMLCYAGLGPGERGVRLSLEALRLVDARLKPASEARIPTIRGRRR